jgi:hypothetical protein
MNNLIQTLLVLCLWTLGITISKAFIAYAPSIGYTDAEVSSITVLAAAWLSTLTYLIAVTRFTR